MNKTHTSRHYRFFLVFYMSVLAYFSLVSADNIVLQNDPLSFLHADKLKHLFAYGVLTVLLLMSGVKIAASCMVSILFSCVLEFLQLFTNRYFDIYDIIANTTGATIVYYYYKKKLENKLTSSAQQTV